jgi:hypothetical protein
VGCVGSTLNGFLILVSGESVQAVLMMMTLALTILVQGIVSSNGDPPRAPSIVMGVTIHSLLLVPKVLPFVGRLS